MEVKPAEAEAELKGKGAQEAVVSETKEVSNEKAEVPAAEDAPDPDEDDLDDLDDMLDEFSTTKIEIKEESATISVPGRPAPATVADEPDLEGLSDDDFAKQLQAGMADLLGGIDTSPEMQAEFENMMKELSNAAGLGDLASLGLPTAPANAASQPAASASSSKAAPTVAAEESFQETIKKTMERMQASGEQATAAAAADDTDDILAELMKQMQSTGLDGESNEEDFSKMLLGMMEQLTNKDILYEPMKELHDKFPTWMEKNKDTVPKEDLKRYEEQQRVVAEIVAKFEEPTYKDENAKDREYIVERMQLMQAAGSPPPDLVGDMASAQEAFGAPDEGCPQQ